MVKQFKKKPVIIEAIQFTGENAYEIEKWSDGKVTSNLTYTMQLAIFTLEGTMKATKHDWIIKGVAGEFYPCRPDIFEQTYEEVLDPTYENSQENTNDLLGD